MNKTDSLINEENLQDALQGAADSMALEGYTVTPEMTKRAEAHIRENHVAIFKQVDAIFKKDRTSTETKAA